MAAVCVKVVCIIQAHLGSTRFPKKVMATLGTKPVHRWVTDAVARVRGIHETHVAWAEDFPEFPGWDVLSRYHAVATRTGAEAIVRVTSDCPLIDPQVVQLVLRKFLARRADRWDPPGYVSNIYPRRTWPDGQDVEVFTRQLLDEANTCAVLPGDREHVTPWMQRCARVSNIELPVDWSWVRLTVDTLEDLRWLQTAIHAPRSGSSVPFGLPPTPPKPAPSDS